MFDFSKVERLKSKADGGDAKAQIELGKEYLSGRNVQANFARGYAYFAMAARKNDPEGLYLVADCQDNGTGTTVNPSLAFQNYLKASNLGHVKSILALAHYYETGRGGIVEPVRRAANAESGEGSERRVRREARRVEGGE